VSRHRYTINIDIYKKKFSGYNRFENHELYISHFYHLFQKSLFYMRTYIKRGKLRNCSALQKVSSVLRHWVSHCNMFVKFEFNNSSLYTINNSERRWSVSLYYYNMYIYNINFIYYFIYYHKYIFNDLRMYLYSF